MTAMPTKPLGSTGLTVSQLGLETVKIGRTAGLKYPGDTKPVLPTDAEMIRLFEEAQALGVTLIDTAPAYGTSEARIGAMMRDASWFGSRDDWTICTKAGETFDGSTSTYDFSGDAITASIERSLVRLKTDRIDIALVHSDGQDERIVADGEAIEALRRLKERGLIRTFGMSTKTVAGGIAAIDAGCEVMMITLNPSHEIEMPVIEYAAQRGVGVLIKKALASGHATDPIDALRFVRDRGGDAISSVIVGTANPANLRANAAAFG